MTIDAEHPHRIEQRFTVQYNYPVIFTRDCLNPKNKQFADLIENRANNPVLLPIFDRSLFNSHRGLEHDFENYCRAHKLTSLPALVAPGGEVCKHSDELQQRIYQAVLDYKIDRHSYIVAFGGGAVIDAVGYAAATAHRGIRLIRVPTTVLAQNDAAIGVKNAINYQRRKNFLGTFTPPHAVINDFDFLDSLEERDKRAGIAESIKVALIKDAALFDELFSQREALARFDQAAMENMIIKGAQWHLRHIASADPFETGSSRPLDFGHWVAHKLEEISGHELRHGEAVAIGIALDTLYSARAESLNAESAEQVLSLLVSLGFALYHPSLNKINVENALNEFREHLGGKLCITLLDQIGKGRETDHIDTQTMKDCILELKKRKRQ